MENICKHPLIFFKPLISYKTSFGNSIALSGNSPILNNWNEEKLINLFWTKDDIWENLIEIRLTSLNSKLEYKYLLKNEKNYERSENRILDLSKMELFDFNYQSIILIVQDKWEEPSLTRITIEKIPKINPAIGGPQGVVVLGKALLPGGNPPPVLINRIKKLKELIADKTFGLAVFTGADPKKRGIT